MESCWFADGERLKIGIGVDIVSEAMESKVEVGDDDGGSLEDWFCGEGDFLRRLIWGVCD